MLAEDWVQRTMQASCALEAGCLLHPEPAAARGEKTSREDAGTLTGKSESVTPLLLFQTFKKYEICILSPRGLAQ